MPCSAPINPRPSELLQELLRETTGLSEPLFMGARLRTGRSESPIWHTTLTVPSASVLTRRSCVGWSIVCVKRTREYRTFSYAT